MNVIDFAKNNNIIVDEKFNKFWIKAYCKYTIDIAANLPDKKVSDFTINLCKSLEMSDSSPLVSLIMETDTNEDELKSIYDIYIEIEKEYKFL